MIIERIVEPKAEPVTSSQVAMWCSAGIQSVDNLPSQGDTELLDELVLACREYLERWTNPSVILVESGWRITLDKSEVADLIRLPIGPLVSVDSVTFYDNTDASTAVTTATYRAITGEASSIILNPSTQWPDNPRDLGCLVIEITAGYQASTGPLTQASTNTAAVVTGSELSGAKGRRVQYIFAAATKGVTFQVYQDDANTFAAESSVYGPMDVAAGADLTYNLASAAKDYYRVKIISTTAGQAGTASVIGRRGIPPVILLVGLRELVKFWYAHRGDGQYLGQGGWKGDVPTGLVEGILERLRPWRVPVVA